jgi:Ca-activated chloride channel homolog
MSKSLFKFVRPNQVYFGAAGVIILAWLLGLCLGLQDIIKENILIYRGNTAYKDGNFGDAEIFYKEALSKNHLLADVKYNLANAYYKQKRYKEAAQTYEIAIGSGRNTGFQESAWHNLGNSLFLIGDTIKSIKAYEVALLRYNDDVSTRKNLLFVLDQLKKGRDNIKDVPDKKQQKEAQSEDAAARTSSADEEAGKPTSDRSNQDVKLSEKEMESLFDRISKSERDVRGRIGKGKQRNKTPENDELNY